MSKEITLEPKLDSLLEDFDHPNPRINQEAFDQIVAYWPNEALPFFLSKLDSQEIYIRRKAIMALGRYGASILPTLTKIAESEREHDLDFQVSCMKIFVKVAVSEEYISFPDKSIQLIESLIWNDNPQLILTIIPLLKLLGDQGLALLLESSQDKKNVLRSVAAITALGEINNTLAQETLSSLLNETDLDPLVLSSVKLALDKRETKKF